MTRVLVTGGTGFIGQHLVSALVARDRKVRVIDRRPPLSAVPGVEYLSGSVLDPGLVDEALRDVDEVYHLAGLPGMWLPDKGNFHTVNFEGTQVVIAAARKRGTARFLHCSTESILFRPASLQVDGYEHSLLSPQEMPGLYTRSKMLAEQSAVQAAAAGFSTRHRHADHADRAARSQPDATDGDASAFFCTVAFRCTSILW